MPDLQVAIVGGGIAGLTLACCLKQRGIPFEGVEITPAFAPVGAGIALGPNAMAVMRRLGLAEALEARGRLLREGPHHAQPLCAARNFVTRIAPASATQKAFAGFLEASPVIGPGT